MRACRRREMERPMLGIIKEEREYGKQKHKDKGSTIPNGVTIIYVVTAYSYQYRSDWPKKTNFKRGWTRH